MRFSREHKLRIIADLSRSDCKMTFEVINGVKISVIGVINVLYDAQAMLVTKNVIHPREVI